MITGFQHIVQLSVFAKSIGAGFIIGVFFTLFSVLNVFHGKNAILVFFRDFIFIVASSIFTFLFALKYNAGIIRFYIIAGELIGFILCYLILPASVRHISVLIKNTINKIKKYKK